MKSAQYCHIDAGTSTVYTRTGHTKGEVIERCRRIAFDGDDVLDKNIHQISHVENGVKDSCRRVLGFGCAIFYGSGDEHNIEMNLTDPDFIEIRAIKNISPKSKLQHQNVERKTEFPSQMDGIYSPSSALEVRPCKLGYGVFARRHIQASTLIESSPYVPIANPIHITSTILRDYLFSGQQVTHPLHGLAMGFGSLFNHNDNPNAYWIFDSTTCTVSFYAEKFIQAGTEIFISYGADWFSSRNLRPI